MVFTPLSQELWTTGRKIFRVPVMPEWAPEAKPEAKQLGNKTNKLSSLYRHKDKGKETEEDVEGKLRRETESDQERG